MIEKIKIQTIKILRELRNREIQIFLFALTLGTAAITAPSLLADRLSEGVRTYSEDVLGGDARLRRPEPLSDTTLAEAAELGIDISRSISFASVVVNPLNANFLLARIRSVEDNYPLKGEFQATSILSKEDQQGVTTEELISPPPSQGEIWLDEYLALVLEVEVGDMVSLGETELIFTKYLLSEPGPNSFFSFAPRAIINDADLAATELVIPGSRLNYIYLWGGAAEVLDPFLDIIEANLRPGERIIRANDEDAGFTDILRRLRAFLLLSGSMCIFLSAFALLLSIRHFMDRNRRYVALLKTIGYSPAQSLIYLFKRIAPAALIAYVVGCLVGWLGYWIISLYLAPILPPAQSEVVAATPFIISAVSAIICLLFFGMPGLWRLAYSSPLSLLHQAEEKLSRANLINTLIACAGIFVLLLFYSRNFVISSVLFGAVVLLIIVMAIVGFLVMKLIHDKFINRQISVGVKIALISLFRQWQINSFQILSFAAAFMLIGILLIMRISFINDWQNDVKPDTPNYFLVNIAPERVDDTRDFLAENEIEQGIFAGMVTGKLNTVDGEDLRDRVRRLGTYTDEAERPLNLGLELELPSHNLLIDGEWWEDDQLPEDDIYPISFEEGIAEDFGVVVGSRLEFLIGARTITTEVTSIRQVDWGDFKPNFYVIFQPSALEDFPRTYITSFFVPAERQAILRTMVQTFPTSSLISIDRILDRLADIFALVSNAMQLILLLSLLAAIAVFVAAVQVSLDIRARTTATLRLIGETSKQALFHNLLEFCFIGLLAGLLAVLGSEIVIWVLYEYLLDQSFVPHYYFWFMGAVGSTILACIAGFLWTRREINKPPSLSMRDAAMP